MEEQKPLRAKLWIFGESPFTWGGIGVILGAIGAVVSLKVLFIIGAIPLGVGLIRARFFEGHGRWRTAGCNTLLCLAMIVMLFGIWKVIPKPKEFPTAEEIASAFKKQMDATPPVNKTEQAKEVAPATPPARVVAPNAKKSKPKSKAATSVPSDSANYSYKMEPVPDRPADTSAAPKATQEPAEKPTVAPEKPAPSIALPPVKQGIFTITQSSKSSTRADAPYQSEVIVQTTLEFPSLKFAMECDKALVDATAMLTAGGVRMMVRSAIVKEHPNIFLYSYDGSVPPFGPSNPLVITAWSKEPIVCNQVATF